MPISHLLLLVLFASVLGVVAAQITTLPMPWSAVASAGVCGGLIALLWWMARLPVVPILMVALVGSLALRVEVNLIKLNQELEPSGLQINLTLLLAVVLAGHYFFTRLFSNDKATPIFPRSISLTLAALFGWCAFAVGDSRYPALGGAALWLLAAWMLLCFVTTAVGSDRAMLRVAVLAGVLTVGACGVLGLLQYGFDFGASWTALGAPLEEDRLTFADGGIRRISGLLRTPTSFAWYLTTWLPVLLAFAASRYNGLWRWQRLLCLAAAVLGVLVLILTYSRGSWAAFGGALLILAPALNWILPVAERRGFKRNLAVAMALFSLLCLPFAESLYIRLTEDDRGSASSRLPSMEVASALIADNPLLGVGLNTYRIEARRYDETSRLVTDELVAVHNMYLHMAAEAGTPAASLFLIFLALVLWRGWLTVARGKDLFLRTLALGLSCGLFAYMWTGLKEPGSFGSSQLRLCFLFCGLLLATDRVRRLDEERTVINSYAI